MLTEIYLLKTQIWNRFGDVLIVDRDNQGRAADVIDIIIYNEIPTWRCCVLFRCRYDVVRNWTIFLYTYYPCCFTGAGTIVFTSWTYLGKCVCYRSQLNHVLHTARGSYNCRIKTGHPSLVGVSTRIRGRWPKHFHEPIAERKCASVRVWGWVITWHPLILAKRTELPRKYRSERRFN